MSKTNEQKERLPKNVSLSGTCHSNAFSAKCPFGVVVVQRKQLSANCPFDNYHSANCRTHRLICTVQTIRLNTFPWL